MLATPRTPAAPTVTGRSYARRVATLTGSHRMTSGTWVAEACGIERRRRAVVCRIGRLTGTPAPRWTGEIGEKEWRTVLAAGAAALVDAEALTHEEELHSTAGKFAQDTADSGSGGVSDRTRNGRVEALVDELLAARPASPVDLLGNDERVRIQHHSPFRGGPRYITASGRYGDGTRAMQG